MRQNQKDVKRKNRTLKEVALLLLKFDGWQLSEDGTGKTPKGQECSVEFVRCNTYKQTKEIDRTVLVELWKKKGAKVLLLSDPDGTYYFWLDAIKDQVTSKDGVVYIQESLASIVQRF